MKDPMKTHSDEFLDSLSDEEFDALMEPWEEHCFAHFEATILPQIKKHNIFFCGIFECCWAHMSPEEMDEKIIREIKFKKKLRWKKFMKLLGVIK